MTLDLSGAARLDRTHLVWLNEIAAAARQPFNDLVRRLGAPHEHDIDWWVTPLATRNVYACALFLRCCRLLLALRVLDSGEKPREVIVETPGCARALRGALAQRHPDVSVRSRVGAVAYNARLMLALAYRIGAAVFHAVNQIVLGRAFGARRSPAPAQPIVLVDTFLYRDSFRAAYRDRHYPGLLDALSPEERRRVFFLPTYYKVRNYFGLFSGLSRSGVNFLLKEHYLRPRDYAHALMHPLRARALRLGQCTFEGFEIGWMVGEAMRESLASSGSIEALLRYRLARRLAEARLPVARVIDWFENQELDHGSNAGLRHFMPETPIVGYQGFVVSDQYLCAFPTTDEMRLGLIPQRVSVTGSALVERAKAWCPELPVSVAPAFRFAGVWRERERRADGGMPRVLVGLPLMRKEAAAIANLVTEALRELRGAGEWRVRAKAHPSYAHELPRELELVDGEFDELLDGCDMVVSAASSVCVQALANGVPVAVVGDPHGITFNPVPNDAPADMWALCYTASELARALMSFASRDAATAARHRAQGVALRARLFSPVTPESVRAFLGFEERTGARAVAPVQQC